jgi:tRNA (guanine-N7-)-methyltransferase
MVDIGCGYGGLCFALANMFPEAWVLGMEIREKVVNYVTEKIRAMRVEFPKTYDQTSVILTNAMKHLPNFFEKG